MVEINAKLPIYDEDLILYKVQAFDQYTGRRHLDPAVAFGLVLRRVRKEARLTQEQVALAAGVERNFVSLMERGINQPTVRVIFKLARALDTSPSALMSLVEQHVAAHVDRSE